MNLTNSKYWNLWIENKKENLNKDLIEQIIHIIREPRNKKIIEVGPGRGDDILFLGKLGAKVAVLDFAKKVLDIMKKKADKENIKISLIFSNCENIILQDTFDLVYSQGLLEHFTEPSKILKEQKKLIEKGKILIDIPNKFGFYVIFMRFKSKMVSLIKNKNINYLKGQKNYSFWDIKRWAKENKLKICHSYGRDFLYLGRLNNKNFTKRINRILKNFFNFIGVGKYVCCSVGAFMEKYPISLKRSFDKNKKTRRLRN